MQKMKKSMPREEEAGMLGCMFVAYLSFGKEMHRLYNG